jgi:D-lactate dehydrogenase
MKIAFFDSHRFEREAFSTELSKLGSPHQITFLETRLSMETAPLAQGHPVLCPFVNDKITASVAESLHKYGVRLLALRSAGFNHVDVAAVNRLGMRVVRVPAYSPHAVAEHSLCLLLTLIRKVHRAWNRVRELNFSLEGLVGFDLHGKTVGVVGTGNIGSVFANIMLGLGCRVLAHDTTPNPALSKRPGLTYVTLDELFSCSHVISLHVPLTPNTRHLLDERAFASMKEGVYVVNTGRGALIDTPAMVEALKSGKLGGAALDVYEEEEGVFFFDLSDRVLQDDVLARLLTFPNVLITSHQAFLTKEALANIAQTTLTNISAFEAGAALENEVRLA